MIMGKKEKKKKRKKERKNEKKKEKKKERKKRKKEKKRKGIRFGASLSLIGLGIYCTPCFPRLIEEWRNALNSYIVRKEWGGGNALNFYSDSLRSKNYKLH